MRGSSPISELTDKQLETLVIAWMAQELAIAPEGADLVLRLLSGDPDPYAPLSRARTLELTQTPDMLQSTYARLDDAVSDWLDAYLIDILALPGYSIPVSALSVNLATGLSEEEQPYLHAFLKANGIMTNRSPHHWPGYDCWHLDPVFVDKYRQDLLLASYTPSSHGGTVGDRYAERVTRLTKLSQQVNQHVIGTAIPSEPEAALRVLCVALEANPQEILAVERILLAERESQLRPVVKFQIAA